MILGRNSTRLVPRAFKASWAPATRSLTTKYEEPHYRLVLIRHGESQWNRENRFTGWVDVPLSEKGESEAREGGQLLKAEGIKFDKAYTSYLRRAIKTCWLVLEQMDQMHIPIVPAWQLNERHYGALSGLDKQETVRKHGKDKVHLWRRSYDVPPPLIDMSSEWYPGNDPKYSHLSKAELPRSESLQTTLTRVLPFWSGQIGPDIKSGKTILVAAHGNSLRALVKSLDDIDEEIITELNIPTGIPLVYDLDRNLKPIKHPKAFAPLRGRYLGDQDKIREKIEGVKKQTN